MERGSDFTDMPAYWVFVFIWLAGWVAASILYARRKGLPIFPQAPREAPFAERGVSGHAGGLRALGGARNCLLVFIHDGRLRITPIFPFNLAFLPQVWGLDHDIQRRDIIRVEREPGLFGDAVVITYRKGLDAERITLKLRDPTGFEKALTPAGSHTG